MISTTGPAELSAQPIARVDAREGETDLLTALREKLSPRGDVVSPAVAN